MKQTKQKSVGDKFIAVDDLVSRLSLLEGDVFHWLNRDKPLTKKDHMGRSSVPMEFLGKYSSCPEYLEAFKRSVAGERLSREADDLINTSRFKRERFELLDKYEVCIGDLEILHRKYLDSVNGAGSASSSMAAYLLFGRVISTLKMACLCLRNGYWTSGSLLREIDECLDVAKYFVITKDTARGSKALHQWFRQNRAPRHEDCRIEIAARMATLLTDKSKEQHRELLDELYQKKSKFTHPTFATVREVTKYYVGREILVEEIDYGPCGYERKLHELTYFFQSSIWSSFQTFLLCFAHELPLLEEDIQYLENYDKKFTEWNKVHW